MKVLRNRGWNGILIAALVLGKRWLGEPSVEVFNVSLGTAHL